MKNLKYITILLAAVSILIVTSCKKSFYTDANVNPNAPPSLVPSVLLSSAEGALAYTQGGTFDIVVTLFDQQTQGTGRQAQAYYQYVVTTQDLDDPWSAWYTNVFQSERDLVSRSDANGYNSYSGIGRVLLAYTLQVTVDVWGDMPYSQAFKGEDNIHLYPSYDKATDLYAAMNTLLDQAIVKLSGDPGPASWQPGSEDRIYGGDLSKWLKFAHAEKARIAIHQSKGNAAMATTALSEIALSFTSNADNATFPFGSSESTANPWYQFNEERTGDITFPTSTLANMMAANTDPRFDVYFDSTYNDAWGVGLGNYYGTLNSPIELINYDELEFMKAEAILRSSGDFASAQTAYQAAITANFGKLGASGAAAYITAHGTLPVSSVNDAIAAVAVEEYTALYLNPEAWTLYRRTGSPALTAIAGTQGVPRRFRYVQTEYFYNTANTPQATLWSPKLFWDN